MYIRCPGVSEFKYLIKNVIVFYVKNYLKYKLGIDIKAWAYYCSN